MYYKCGRGPTGTVHVNFSTTGASIQRPWQIQTGLLDSNTAIIGWARYDTKSYADNTHGDRSV